MNLEYSEGRMIVDGDEHRSDLKIIGDRVIGHWWRKEGHGLAADDMEDILSARPRVVVIGAGYAGRMQVQESLRTALETRGIQVIVQTTHEAVKTFNHLTSEGENVAGAFHLTC